MNFINYNSHYIDNDDINAVISSLRSKKITQGKENKLFEEKIKSVFKTKYCSVVSFLPQHYIYVVLHLDSKKNIVISSPITFLAGPNSVNYCDATIDFVDIDKRTYNLDLNKLEQK